jgi:hypothetical protein
MTSPVPLLLFMSSGVIRLHCSFLNIATKCKQEKVFVVLILTSNVKCNY